MSYDDDDNHGYSYRYDPFSNHSNYQPRSSNARVPKITNRPVPGSSSAVSRAQVLAPLHPEASSNYVTRQLGSVVARLYPNNASETAKITGFQSIASYSWVSAATPTIIVPGAPPIWSPQPTSRVPADSGLRYIHQNAARMGDRSPLVPLFAAVFDMGKEDILRDIDIVSDRNNLRKLLRWATGVADEDFRIDVELAGNTCLFTRVEEKVSENVQDFRGFGDEYKKAATRNAPGHGRTTGHYQIASYTLAGLRILLRFEVDACTDAGNTAEDDDLDGLASAFSALNTSTSRSGAKTKELEEPVSPFRSELTILHKGSRQLVPRANWIELKTRASHKPLDWDDIYPQLYLSQTAYLYLAKHNRGTFTPAEKFKLGSSQMATHASVTQAGMGKLVDGLKQILKAVRKVGDGVGLSLICQRGQLTLYKRQEGAWHSVGSEIRNLFRQPVE
ncbi:hypothetical protein FRB99_008589 [Tulasnella sp. 403]|nr:hypothetical protein FRB99_008589 [Tulasnella sp. 403]